MAGTLIWRLKPQKPFELRRGGRIRLDSVVDAHGQPIPGARVQIVIESLESQDGGEQTVNNGENGQKR